MPIGKAPGDRGSHAPVGDDLTGGCRSLVPPLSPADPTTSTTASRLHPEPVGADHGASWRHSGPIQMILRVTGESFNQSSRCLRACQTPNRDAWMNAD